MRQHVSRARHRSRCAGAERTLRHAGSASKAAGLASAEYERAYTKSLLAAVIKLQRAYRLSSYVYRHFGPELFVDSRGVSSGAAHAALPALHPRDARLSPAAAMQAGASCSMA